MFCGNTEAFTLYFRIAGLEQEYFNVSKNKHDTYSKFSVLFFF